MALAIDSSAPLVGYEALRILIEAVRDTDDVGGEHHALEWKAQVDLSAAAGRFQLARAIIAFANRPVESSRRHFGGNAYVLIGVEPGNVHGAQQWDGQELEPALAPYLGTDGPIWHHDNITVDGKSVLVVSVMPPKAGDRIHTVRKQFTPKTGHAAREGEIFVRRSSKTERPNTAEIRALENRFRAGSLGKTIDVDIGINSSPIALPLDLDEVAIRAWLTAESDALLSIPAAPTPPSLVGSALLPWLADSRTREEYEREVEKYIRLMAGILPDLCRSTAIDLLVERQFLVQLHNPTETAIEQLKIRLQFPPGFEAHFSLPQPERPRPPLPLGTSNIFTSFRRDMPVPVALSGPRRLSHTLANGAAGAFVTFSVESLHADESLDLDALTVLSGMDVVLGSTVEALARATAISHSGVASFKLPILVSKKAFNPCHLIGAVA